jgi:hypothetical protein
MFCPSCGSENAQSQKFCRRCGTNLLALQAATEMVSEIAQGQAANQLDPKFVLKMVTLFGLLGFFIVTAGATALSIVQLASTSEGAQHDPPFGLMLAFFGYTALTLICWMLFRWVKQVNTRPVLPVISNPVTYAPPTSQTPAASVTGANTNPALNAAPAYQSIIEDETRQFVKPPQDR